MKNKKNLKQRIESWFTSRPLLKLFAFILAVLVWLYIKTEITRMRM